MEHINSNSLQQINSTSNNNEVSSEKAFVQANTIGISLEEMKTEHIIPVFIKDNETLISHADFIQVSQEVISDLFSGETILKPAIRISHPIKGRIPEAKNKSVHELQEWEKSVYFERMAFIVEIPTVTDRIDGNPISLMIGGVKSYNLDNLYQRKGSDEHFKIFIGFQNQVCTNLCVWSDGSILDLKVNSIGQLKGCIRTMISQYNMNYHLSHLKELSNCAISESQFAQIIGRCRMYPYLPQHFKKDVPQLLFGDTQLGAVVREYYKDERFGKSTEGLITLWKMYNLFTGINKSTYIDQFVERGVNAFDFIYNIKSALHSNSYNWYLS